MGESFRNIVISCDGESKHTHIIIDGINYSNGAIGVKFVHDIRQDENKNDISLSLTMKDRPTPIIFYLD
jgi:hypothetical protein